MLTHLQVNDFTLVDELNLDLASGLTVLTGETGAGKSILLDALHLALGDRADADKVKPGAERVEVCASFDVSKLSAVQRWLSASDLDADECIVRRIVTKEGRSRAYINGQLVTLTQLRALGEQLIDLHSQHEHQSLLQVANHRKIVDAFGKHTELAKAVKEAFDVWQSHQAELDRVRSNSEEINARYQLLRYQVDELDQLDLADGELESLEATQKKLENSVITQQSCQQVIDICSEGEQSVQYWLQRAQTILGQLPYKSARVTEVESMLDNALIHVDEASRELQRETEIDGLDGGNLPEIEQRLSSIYDIARKHRITPEELPNLHLQLAQELAGLRSGDEQLALLESAVVQALKTYQECAARLSEARRKTAKHLAKSVNQQLACLAMAQSKFEVCLSPLNAPSRHGQEQVELLISTVPGQPAKPLVKIASGGELSRISLAIQVVAAKTSVTPTLVFDEVDVGIGGATGDVVGRMLRELGEATQVLCVTHLAQVASKANQHLLVEKTFTKKAASTRIKALEGEEQVFEIARMMGGAIESEQSIAHAREMLVVG